MVDIKLSDRKVRFKIYVSVDVTVSPCYQPDLQKNDAPKLANAKRAILDLECIPIDVGGGGAADITCLKRNEADTRTETYDKKNCTLLY